uniref:Transposase n=1 Tax=Mesocestoides corti TaxID=53468 RepID=A0A5K3FGI1_MESCO
MSIRRQLRYVLSFGLKLSEPWLKFTAPCVTTRTIILIEKLRYASIMKALNMVE